MTKSVEMYTYTTTYCPYCQRAQKLLADYHVTPIYYSVDERPELRQEMITRSQRRTLPQIFIDKQHIGGCDDLYQLHQSQQLRKLLGLSDHPNT